MAPVDGITRRDQMDSFQLERISRFEGEGAHYANEFVCVPVDAEIRPLPNTPKPRVHGPQTAIVTTPFVIVRVPRFEGRVEYRVE